MKKESKIKEKKIMENNKDKMPYKKNYINIEKEVLIVYDSESGLTHKAADSIKIKFNQEVIK